MIKRKNLIDQTLAAIHRSPIAAILGPRQCGKTTLAREIANSQKSYYFDLEDVVSAARLETSPQLTLQSLDILIIIDEIQRKPDLFPILRVLADRLDSKAKFLI